MTQPKVATFYSGGARHYADPVTKEAVPGVTSVLNMLPKPFLAPWNAKMTAEKAVDNLDILGPMASRDRDGAVGWLKAAAKDYTRGRAAIGSEAHEAFEALALGQPVGQLSDPEVVAIVRNYEDLLNTIEPEFLETEQTVWSDTHKYGGSFDAIAKVSGYVAVLDNKTSKSAHAETALQLAAYRFADFILRPDGKHDPIPAIERGLILHVRADKWQIYEAPVGEEIFEYFLDLRHLFEFGQIEGKLLGRPLLKGKAA